MTFGSELLLFAETQPEPQPGFPQGEGEPPNALKLIQKKLPPIHLNYLHSFNFIFSLKKVWLFETLLLTLHPKKKILGLYRIKDNRTRLHPGDLQAGHFFLETGMVNQKPHNIEEQIRLLRDKGMNLAHPINQGD